MIRIHRRISKAVTALTLSALVLTGCTSEASNIGRAKDKDGKPDVVDTGFTLSTVGSYDSADTAVVLSTDSNNKAVSLINMDTGKQYTLYYDGTTYGKDKYGGPMSVSQIKAGDVVDVTFLKGKKKLASIQRSPEAWVYDEVHNYDLAGANRTAVIGSQTYSLPAGVVVLSEGRRVEAGEVVSQDVVTISGINHKIYSVNVDKGHGYLRLKNDQPLLGGWIEVGNSVIRQIKEDMLLTVPEGSYQVVLSNNNLGCVKEVTVERDKEVVLDVGDLEVAEDAIGKILFTVEPEDAAVSVDGKPVDISKPVELKYGIHQIQAEANGYDTLTKHIQVGSEYATISFKLEETRKKDETNSVSDNSTTPEQIPWEDTLETSRENKPSVSDNTLSSVSENALGTSSNYKVYVDSPRDVEVYLDGNYVGLSPVRFTKTVGRHEITLKKSGYKTKTYTIYLENTRRDETYSFSALEKQNSGNNGNNGNSGNDNNNSSSGSTGTPPLWEIKVNPDMITIEKGQEKAFEAHVYLNGTAQNDASITWGLDGQKSEETKFKGGDEPSTLIVASDESAESLTVTATYMDSETGQTLLGQATVTVTEKTPVIEHVCSPQPVEKIEPDCITAGKQAYYHCEGCNKNYEDAAGEIPIADINAWGKIDADALKHDWGEWEVTKPATETEPGEKERICKRCEAKDTEPIPTNDSEEDDNNEAGKNGSGNNLTTTTVEITQEAHPIRKWFSSLFK